MQITIITNPSAGKSKLSRLDTAVTCLKKRGITPEIRKTGRRGDAVILAREEVKKQTDIVLAAGGDGTINEVANGIAGSAVTLAVLPLGTANVFSLEANLPSDPHAAVDLIFTGTARRINLGQLRLRARYEDDALTHHFALMAGIGFDGGVLSEIQRSSIARWGRAAYVFTGIRVLSRYTHSPLTITVDHSRVIHGYSAVISNGRCYGGRFMVTPHASLMDDSLELCVFKKRGPLSMVKAVFKLLIQHYTDREDFLYCKAKEIEVTSSDEVFVQADGDCLGRLPAQLSVDKHCLSVILPPPD